ncbi:MAG: pseudouridine synthase [Mycobacteriaceae bacterium]
MRQLAPLPIREGLNPTRLRMPVSGHWATVYEYLVDRFPHDSRRITEKIDSAEVVDLRGHPIDRTTPFVPNAFVFLYRDPPVEVRVPFDIDILHRDENLVVIDKPHFLATTPRGAHIVETALVRLRRELELPELSPAHRLDRLTAGVLVFTVRQEIRGAYQRLFADRKVRKEYRARALVQDCLVLPRRVSSRIIKNKGSLIAIEEPGEPNSVTDIELIDSYAGIGNYRLRPHTGKMHQLRVHMNALGIPIIGDPLYPRVIPVSENDFRHPLQLLAQTIEFTDPLSGAERFFETHRTLD